MSDLDIIRSLTLTILPWLRFMASPVNRTYLCQTRDAAELLGFSARSYSRILKAARTIAGLTEALRYRSLDRKV